MLVKIFINEDTPEARQSKELGERLEAEGYSVELVTSDSLEATQAIELYDIYSYPSFVVVRDDGSQLEIWRGTVPLISDLKHFLNQ